MVRFACKPVCSLHRPDRRPERPAIGQYNARVKKTQLTRADGRYVYWYAFDAPPPHMLAVEEQERGHEQIELRWDPLLGEQVIVSTGRQARTFLPPDEYCPLCPTAIDGAFATEIPSADFELA